LRREQHYAARVERRASRGRALRVPQLAQRRADGFCGAHLHVRKRRMRSDAARIMRVMFLDSDSCYRALATHDARFDGRFFVGVRSTRIYCRPVCTVRLPKRENCRFYQSAAAAEVDGFRPCLRCRPELAPGLASVDASARFALAAVALIEDGVLED